MKKVCIEIFSPTPNLMYTLRGFEFSVLGPVTVQGGKWCSGQMIEKDKKNFRMRQRAFKSVGLVIEMVENLEGGLKRV